MTQNKEMQELVNTCKRSFKSVQYTKTVVDAVLMNMMMALLLLTSSSAGISLLHIGIPLLRISACFRVGEMRGSILPRITYFISPKNGFSPDTVTFIRGSIHAVVAVCWMLTLPLTSAQPPPLHPTQHPPVISWLVGSALGFTAMVVVRSSIRPIRAYFGIISFLCSLLLAYKWESLIHSCEHALYGAVVGLVGAATVGYWDDVKKVFVGELLGGVFFEIIIHIGMNEGNWLGQGLFIGSILGGVLAALHGADLASRNGLPYFYMDQMMARTMDCIQENVDILSDQTEQLQQASLKPFSLNTVYSH